MLEKGIGTTYRSRQTSVKLAAYSHSAADSPKKVDGEKGPRVKK